MSCRFASLFLFFSPNLSAAVLRPARFVLVSFFFSIRVQDACTTADEDEITVDDSLDLASESIKVSSGIPNVGSYDGRVPQLDFDQPTLWRVQARASRARTDRVGCHGIRSYSERYGAAVIRELASCAVRAISPLYDPPAAQDTRAAAAAVPPSFTAAARRECCRPAACGASCRRER